MYDKFDVTGNLFSHSVFFWETGPKLDYREFPFVQEKRDLYKNVKGRRVVRQRETMQNSTVLF
jgi:hypothetical protein